MVLATGVGIAAVFLAIRHCSLESDAVRLRVVKVQDCRLDTFLQDA